MPICQCSCVSVWGWMYEYICSRSLIYKMAFTFRQMRHTPYPSLIMVAVFSSIAPHYLGRLLGIINALQCRIEAIKPEHKNTKASLNTLSKLSTFFMKHEICSLNTYFGSYHRQSDVVAVYRLM